MNIRVAFAIALTATAAVASCGGELASDDCAATDTCIADAGPLSCPFGSEEIDDKCVALPSPPPSDASAVPPLAPSPPDASDGGIDMSSACLGAANRFVIAGDDFVHSGATLTLTLGSVSADDYWLGGAPFQTIDGKASAVSVVINNNLPGDLNYNLTFASSHLGTPLEVRAYSPVDTVGGNDTTASLDIGGEGHGCNHVSGEFNVIEITSYANDAGYAIVHSFTATFLQHCEGHAAYNYGCVHIENCDTQECYPTPPGDD